MRSPHFVNACNGIIRGPHRRFEGDWRGAPFSSDGRIEENRSTKIVGSNRLAFVADALLVARMVFRLRQFPAGSNRSDLPATARSPGVGGHRSFPASTAINGSWCRKVSWSLRFLVARTRDGGIFRCPTQRPAPRKLEPGTGDRRYDKARLPARSTIRDRPEPSRPAGQRPTAFE